MWLGERHGGKKKGLEKRYGCGRDSGPLEDEGPEKALCPAGSSASKTACHSQGARQLVTSLCSPRPAPRQPFEAGTVNSCCFKKEGFEDQKRSPGRRRTRSPQACPAGCVPTYSDREETRAFFLPGNVERVCLCVFSNLRLPFSSLS